jgi:hypothetical protein
VVELHDKMVWGFELASCWRSLAEQISVVLAGSHLTLIDDVVYVNHFVDGG